MENSLKFGSREANPEQRQALSDRAAALNATQGRLLSPIAERLSQRYVDGELSLAEVNAQLDEHYRVSQSN